MKGFFLVLFCFVAISFQAEWSILQDRIMTIALGVSATEDAIFVSGADDGTGAAILRSEDGGQSWIKSPADPSMLYMDVSMSSNTNGVAGGIGMFQVTSCGAYTDDGDYWHGTPDRTFVATSQNVFSMDNTTHFQVGGWQLDVSSPYEDGVMATFDGFNTMEYFGWGLDEYARYGAFPSRDVWYVTGGGWPASAPNTVSSRFEIKTPNYGHGVEFQFNPKPKEEITPEQLRSYRGIIGRTMDGGRTWENVFSDYGRLYFNGIACVNQTSCHAVAEGPEGGWIFRTTDGVNWEEQLFVPDSGFFQVAFKGNSGWAVGAKVLGVTFESLFYHSTDGGNTWEAANAIPNAYPNDVHIVSDDLAYSTAFLRNGLSSVLVYN